MPVCGWTWLPYEPWGWVTFHYGRWHWAMGMGWYWIPTNTWGPGWVSWYRGHDYCGWAPLSYYGYPGVIINNIYYDRYADGHYPHSSRALVLVHKDQLHSKHIAKVALSSESLKGIDKIQLTQSAPEQSPQRSRFSIEKLSGNKVLLRKNEDLSPFRDASRAAQDMSQNREAAAGNKTLKDSSPLAAPSQRGESLRKGTGYPSSDEISLGRTVEETRAESSKSVLSRFYDHISKESQKSGDGSYSRTSSRDSSSAIEKSRSSSRSNSSSVLSSRRSYSPTSTGKSFSSKSSSSKTSTRTKKKKN